MDRNIKDLCEKLKSRKNHYIKCINPSYQTMIQEKKEKRETMCL